MSEEEVEEVGVCYSSPILFDESFFMMELKDGTSVRAYTRKDVVGADERPLFVDDVWPGSKFLARHIDEYQDVYGIGGKKVLELGAGCALPSVVASKAGAMCTIATDYPATNVINTIKEVFEDNLLKDSLAMGLRWGSPEDAQDVLRALPDDKRGKGFDIVLIAEPLWEDTTASHVDLVHTIDILLSHRAGAIVLVSFCHRPNATHKPHDDLAFFDIANSVANLHSEQITTSKEEYRDVDIPEDGPFIEVNLYRMQRN